MNVCNFCGKELAENETCTCSSQNTEQNPAAIPEYNTIAQLNTSTKKNNGTSPVLIIILVLVFAPVLFSILSGLFNKGRRPSEIYEQPLLLLEQAYREADYSYCMEAMIPQVCYDYIKESYGTYWGAAMSTSQNSFRSTINEMKTQLGGYPTVEFYVISAKPVTEAGVLLAIDNNYRTTFNNEELPKFDSTEGYELTCRMSVSSGIKSDSAIINLTSYKTGDKWYIDINDFMALI